MDKQPTEVNSETEMPIEKQTEIETPRKRQLKTIGFWVVMIAGYGAAFVLPSIMAFINPPTEAGFDIIGFFVNMGDEKRIMMLLGTFMVWFGLAMWNRRK